MEAYKSKFSEESINQGIDDPKLEKEVDRMYEISESIFYDLMTRTRDLQKKYRENGAPEEELKEIENIFLTGNLAMIRDQFFEEFENSINKTLEDLKKFEDENPNIKMTRIGENKRGK